MNHIYTLDGKVPFLRSIPYGLQHVLAMFVANIAPIIIVSNACGMDAKTQAMLIQTAMIIAGIGSLIQIFPIFRIGSRLPVIMGISFTFVSVFCSIAGGCEDKSQAYPLIIGSIIVGGLVEAVLGLFAKYWRKIISPLVAACVVTSIGFSLLSVGANSFGGGDSAIQAGEFGSVENWILGGVTLLVCILFNLIAKGPIKQLSVLAGLVVGYIVALCMGKVDFSALQDVTILSLPKILPFKPQFEIGAILSVLVIFLVSATETIGDTSALTSTALKREPTDREISGSLACDGLVSSVSACFGCMPITSFSQNVGLIAMTKVINRVTIATGAGIMILAGIFPAVGAILATLPDAVLGGCTIMMFGTIVVSGFQMLSGCGFTQRNITIAALSLSVGLGFTQIPDLFKIFPEVIQSVFGSNCVTVVFLMSIILDLVIPKEKEEEKPSGINPNTSKAKLKAKGKKH